MTTITAEELEAVHLHAPRGRIGYRADEVDAFLDAAAACLRRGEDPAELARGATFHVARRGGYEPEEVDALLDRIAGDRPAAPDDAGAAGVVGSPAGHPSVAGAASAGTPYVSTRNEPLPEEPGLFARLLRRRR